MRVCRQKEHGKDVDHHPHAVRREPPTQRLSGSARHLWRGHGHVRIAPEAHPRDRRGERGRKISLRGGRPGADDSSDKMRVARATRCCQAVVALVFELIRTSSYELGEMKANYYSAVAVMCDKSLTTDIEHAKQNTAEHQQLGDLPS